MLLDESCLNARAYDKVGQGMEADLWARARRLAENVRPVWHESDGVSNKATLELEASIEIDNATRE